MASIEGGKSRIFSSIPKIKNINKYALHPRSSSVTISKIRKKRNILNNVNNQKNINLSQNDIPINDNNSLLSLKERVIQSERIPVKIVKEFNNSNYSNNNNSFKKNFFENIDIFIQNDLIEEEIIEENNKIESVLNYLIFWDNDHLDRKHINRNSLIASVEKEKTIYTSKNDIEKNYNRSINTYSNKNLSKRKEQKLFLDKNPNAFQLKNKILNSKQKSEEKIDKFDIENNPKFKETTLLLNLKKERKKLENTHKEELKSLYKQLLINQIKKKKFNEVLNNAYLLLEKSRTEYNLSIDILQKRIESTKKYFEAIIKDYDIQNNFLKNPVNKSLNKSLNNNMDNSSKFVRIRKIRTKTKKFEIYEAKVKSYREYLSIVEDINNEIKQYENKFNNISNELNEFMGQINNKLLELNIENKKIKTIYKELNYKETQYYLSILKAGTDTRADGLSWIVKRLIELNLSINYSIFPKFLDQEEIEYLIKISKLELEKDQIKNIIENLKQRKKKGLFINKKISTNKMDKKDLYTKFKFNININEDINYNNLYGSKLIDKLVEQYNNHYTYKNKLYEFNKQNSADNLFIKDIKSKINIFAHNQDPSIFKKEKNKDFVKINEIEKEQYYDILFLRQREKQLNLNIQKLRMKEYLKFKEKFQTIIPMKELIYKQYYHQVYNALFGKNSLDIPP